MEVDKSVPEYLLESNSSHSDELRTRSKLGLKNPANDIDLTFEPASDYSARNSYRSAPSAAKSISGVGKEVVTDFTSLNLAGKNMRDFTFLPNLRTVSEIDLSENGLYYVPQELNKLHNLKRLSMNKNSIDCWDFVPRKLTALSLNQNLISEISKNAAKLDCLLFLDLSHNNLTQISSLNKISSLKYLFLRGNQISKCRDLKVLNRLLELDLESNMISDFEEIRCFEYCSNMKVLSVPGNPCTDDNQDPGDPKSPRFLCTFPTCFGQGLYAKGVLELKSSLIYKAGVQSPEVTKHIYPSEGSLNQARIYFELYCADLGTNLRLEDNSQNKQTRVQYKKSSSKTDTSQHAVKQIYLQQESGLRENLGKIRTTRQEAFSEPNTPLTVAESSKDGRLIRQISPTSPGQLVLFPTRQESFSTQDLPQKEVTTNQAQEEQATRHPVMARWDSQDTGKVSSPQKSTSSPQKSMFGLSSRINNFLVNGTKHLTAGSVGNLGQMSLSPPQRRKLVSQFTFNATSKGAGLDESPTESTPNLGPGFQNYLPQNGKDSGQQNFEGLEQIPRSPEKTKSRNGLTSIFSLSSGQRVANDVGYLPTSRDMSVCPPIKEEALEGSITPSAANEPASVAWSPDLLKSSTNQAANPNESPSIPVGFSFKKGPNPVANLIQRIKPVQATSDRQENPSLTITLDSALDKAGTKCRGCSELGPKLKALLKRSKVSEQTTHLSELCQEHMRPEQVVFLFENLLTRLETAVEQQNAAQELNHRLMTRVEKLEDALCSHMNPKLQARDISPHLAKSPQPPISMLHNRANRTARGAHRRFNPALGALMFQRPRPPMDGYRDNNSNHNLQVGQEENDQMTQVLIEQIHQTPRVTIPAQPVKPAPTRTGGPSKELQAWMQSRGVMCDTSEPVGQLPHPSPKLDLSSKSLQPHFDPSTNPSFTAQSFKQGVALIAQGGRTLHNSRFVSLSQSKLLSSHESMGIPNSGSRGPMGVYTPVRLNTAGAMGTSPAHQDSARILSFNPDKYTKAQDQSSSSSQRPRYTPDRFADLPSRVMSIHEDSARSRTEETRNAEKVLTHPCCGIRKLGPTGMQKLREQSLANSSRSQFFRSLANPSHSSPKV